MKGLKKKEQKTQQRFPTNLQDTVKDEEGWKKKQGKKGKKKQEEGKEMAGQWQAGSGSGREGHGTAL